MLCKKPYFKAAGGGVTGFMIGSSKYKLDRTPFPCGQCINCRINKARAWCFRIELEALDYEYSSFITLTYDDEFLPCNYSLSKRDLQLFFKKLRKKFGSIRYYACGEYGSKNRRPHYHVALFGVPANAGKEIQEAWSFEGVPIGIINIGDLNKDSARYITGYITKGLDKDNVYSKGVLVKRKPEYHTMSRRPGLGVNAVKRLYKQLEGTKEKGLYVKRGKRKIYLGRTLLQKVDEITGYDRSDDSDRYIEELFLKSMSEDDDQVKGYHKLFDSSCDRQEKVHKIFNRRYRNVG